MPVAIDIQAGAIVCRMLGAGGKFLGRRPQAKARKHDQNCVLAVELNTYADLFFSTALTDDSISDEEFCLLISEVDKYKQMKAEIRGRQKQDLSEDEKKKQLLQRMRDEAMMTTCTKLLEELHQAENTGASQ